MGNLAINLKTFLLKKINKYQYFFDNSLFLKNSLFPCPNSLTAFESLGAAFVSFESLLLAAPSSRPGPTPNNACLRDAQKKMMT